MTDQTQCASEDLATSSTWTQATHGCAWRHYSQHGCPTNALAHTQIVPHPTIASVYSRRDHLVSSVEPLMGALISSVQCSVGILQSKFASSTLGPLFLKARMILHPISVIFLDQLALLLQVLKLLVVVLDDL